MIKTLLLGALTAGGALLAAGEAAGPHPAPDSFSDTAPEGLYVEARDATVWGGACHISSEAESGGRRAALSWTFSGGTQGGVDLTGVSVVALVEGTKNLQGDAVFANGEVPEVSSEIWVDASSQEELVAAVDYVRSAASLGVTVAVHEGDIAVSRDGDAFSVAVGDVLRIAGDAMADRSCCTMPESRWYAPLAKVGASVVGNPAVCSFGATESSLAPWTFEDENSVFIASIAP